MINPLLFISLLSLSSLIQAQQPYVGKLTTDCQNPDKSTSAFGYSCNGRNRTCQSYLTFRSQPPYNNVSSIATLLSSDPSELSRLNSVPENASFETNKLVLIPINCSCSGDYYQRNASFVFQTHDTIFRVANNTYQGLSTCQAVLEQNPNLDPNNLQVGDRVKVPLRCACPTKNQTDEGINYLLSYLVTFGEDESAISSMFGVDGVRTLRANQLSGQYPTIFPFTTLLVPLESPPTVSQTRAPPPPPRSSPPPPQPSSPPSSSDRTWVYVLIGVLGGGGFILTMGIMVFWVFFRRSKKGKTDPILTSESFEVTDKSHEKRLDMDSREFLDSLSDIAHQSLKVYTFEELKAATDNFSPTCWMKGSVYRGQISGDFCAIKKMNGDVAKEINVLSKISHFNLIRLSGVCFNEGYWYLVYEYAVNGPLSDYICDNTRNEKFLSWAQRMQIALDVATGLNYIHNYTSPPYVHKDIKSSNVLLDGDFRAKIANFGLARSADGKEGEFALTRHIVGTKGYMAPEYLENGFVSTKLDVYAFGVLVLELLAGKEVSLLYEEVDTNFAEVLYPVIYGEQGKESLKGFMDRSLEGSYPVEMAMFVARLVDCCMKKDPSARPGIDEIVQSLSRVWTTSLQWESHNSVL